MLAATEDGGLFRSRRTGQLVCLPYSSLRSADTRQLAILNLGFHRHIAKKYFIDDLEIDEGTTVIDCGAFVGGFSLGVVERNPKLIIAIEPSPKNYACLSINKALHKRENIEIVQKALGKVSGIGDLNLSASGCDDSLLSPDEGDLKQSVSIIITTLESLVSDYSIDQGNLVLKVEAEGFEPEILAGLHEVRPKLIVIDVSPERDNKDVKDEVCDILIAKGYELKKESRQCQLYQLL